MRLSQSNDRGGPPHLQLGAPSWRLLQSGRLRERQGKPQGVPGQSRRCSRLQFQTRLASEARVRQRIGLTRQALSGWPNPLRHCPLTLESERGQLNYQKREMAAGSCVARQAGRWKVAKDFRSATARYGPGGRGEGSGGVSPPNEREAARVCDLEPCSREISTPPSSPP
jgi:hypothetical protein